MLVGLAGSGQLQTVAHDRLALLAVVEVLPELLGDERHEGVEHLQQDLEELEGLVVGCAVDGLCFTVDIGGLHHLEVPA